MRFAIASMLVALCGACSVAPTAGLSAIAQKPPLPYSILVSGGAFVHPPGGAAGPLARTYSRAPTDGDTGAEAERPEAFDAERVMRVLRLAKVFVVAERDVAHADERRRVAALPVRVGQPEQRRALDTILGRARDAGHDFVLIVDRIQDGAVESQGVNDRWPFTVGAWLFALGALIPDRTYESRARLWVSLRDVHTGERVLGLILEPDAVDLNMIERCSLWGFVQSILVPPFWTSTDPETLVASVRELSTDRLLLSLVDRLKSAEVDETLRRSGPAKIELTATRRGWIVSVDSSEPLDAVSLRLDGEPLGEDFVASFETELLASRTGESPYRYRTECVLPRGGRRLQVLVHTVAAGQSSVTWRVRR
jgi:hypothetical protein